MYNSIDSKSYLVQSAKEDIDNENGNNIDSAELPHQNPACIYKLLTRFQYMANISVFLKNNTFKPSFNKLQRKKINGLLEKDAFIVISISDILSGIKIFNSCFVDEIKNKGIATAFEKSRFIIQAYDNSGKEKIII